jgi:hypothetical protein
LGVVFRRLKSGAAVVVPEGYGAILAWEVRLVQFRRVEEGVKERRKEVVIYHKGSISLDDSIKNEELTPTKYNTFRINAHHINDRIMSTEIKQSAFRTFPPAAEPTWNINVTVNTGSVKS